MTVDLTNLMLWFFGACGTILIGVSTALIVSRFKEVRIKKKAAESQIEKNKLEIEMLKVEQQECKSLIKVGLRYNILIGHGLKDLGANHGTDEALDRLEQEVLEYI